MKLAQAFVEHSSGDFWIPVIKCAEEGEQNSAYDHIVKVGHNEIGTAELPIEGRRRQHDAGEAGDQKLEQKTDAEWQRRSELDLAARHRTQPVEDIDAGRHT